MNTGSAGPEKVSSGGKENYCFGSKISPCPPLTKMIMQRGFLWLHTDFFPPFLWGFCYDTLKKYLLAKMQPHSYI